MISDDKVKLIRKRIAQGRTIAEIVEEVGVSRCTVMRIKNKAPEAVYKENSNSGDNSIKLDYSTQLTKKEEAYTKKLQSVMQLYEDEDEGWCYHLHKSDYRMRTSGTWWSAIAYPESVPENWLTRLKNTGFEVAISPLHDKDKWTHDSPEMINEETGEIMPKGALYKFGDRKKAHWHIIIKSEKRMSYMEANNLIRDITHGPYLQKCRSLKNAYEYFLHINNPNKYQGYDKAEIKEMNNFHLEPNKFELGVMQDEILGVIRDKNITEFYRLTDLYRGQPEYIQIITNKPGIFNALIHSLWLKENPASERVHKVLIVGSEDK